MYYQRYRNQTVWSNVKMVSQPSKTAMRQVDSVTTCDAETPRSLPTPFRRTGSLHPVFPGGSKILDARQHLKLAEEKEIDGTGSPGGPSAVVNQQMKTGHDFEWSSGLWRVASYKVSPPLNHSTHHRASCLHFLFGADGQIENMIFLDNNQSFVLIQIDRHTFH